MNKGVFFEISSIDEVYLTIVFGDEENECIFYTCLEYKYDFQEFRNLIAKGKCAFWNSCDKEKQLVFIGNIIDNQNVEFIIKHCCSYKEEVLGEGASALHIPALIDCVTFREIIPIKKLVGMFDDFFNEYDKAIRM